MDAEPAFLEQLFAEGVLIPSGVDGLYGRGFAFEHVLTQLDALVSRAGAPERPEIMRFPPAMSRADFEVSGYLKGFPQLAGTIHSFCGDDHAHRAILQCLDAGTDWTGDQAASDIVLTPAACYPLYPVLARRGTVPEGGYLADLQSFCFRREPSREPTRMQMFRMHEYVRVGTPDEVMAFRETWMERACAMMASLSLPYEVDVANDPFFGRAGRMLAESQRGQKLKFELLIPVNSVASPTACASFNCHLDHFSQVWPLRLASGDLAHTACVGFGLERLTLALFRHHGLDPAGWPAEVRETLAL
jgi:seryl-tRNA synthetase